MAASHCRRFSSAASLALRLGFVGRLLGHAAFSLLPLAAGAELGRRGHDLLLHLQDPLHPALAAEVQLVQLHGDLGAVLLLQGHRGVVGTDEARRGQGLAISIFPRHKLGGGLPGACQVLLRFAALLGEVLQRRP